MKLQNHRSKLLSRSVRLAWLSAAVTSAWAAQAQTIGFYRFENGDIGPVPAPGYNDPADRTVLDSSGRGNHFQSFHHGFFPGGPNDFTVSPAYQAEVPSPVVPGIGNAPNTRSLSFTNRPGQENNYDLYQTSADLNTYNFNQLTIEATVKFDFTGNFQTFVGKDGFAFPNSAPELSSLYFQLTQAAGRENEIAIATHQADGQFVSAFSGRKVVPNVWYNVAGVSTGSSLQVFIKEADEPKYTAGVAVPFVGQVAVQDRVWTIGRGMFNNQLADFFRGSIDEVRISDVALPTTSLLFPGSVARPAPKAAVSVPAARLQYTLNTTGANSGTLGSAFDGQAQGLATFVSGTAAAAVGDAALRIGASEGDDARFEVPTVEVGDPAADGDFTFSAWVKAGSSSTLQMISVNANTFPFSGYKFYVSPNRALTVEIGNGGTVGGFSTPAGTFPDDGKFHHVSFTFDRSGDFFANSFIRIFFNGTDLTLPGGVPVAGVQTNANLTMGQQFPNTAEPFGLVGSIDQAEYFGGQLSPDQLKVLGAARWRDDADGSWTDTNFNGSTISGPGVAVRFGDRITSARTITLNDPRVAGYVLFDTTAPVTIGGSQELKFDGGLSGAVAQVLLGSHTITAPITLAGGTTFDVASGSTLSITSALTSEDDSIEIVKSGPGSLVLSGPLNHAGPTTVSAGTLTLEGTAKLIGGGAFTVLSGASVNINTTPIAADQTVVDVSNLTIQDGATLTLAASRSGGLGTNLLLASELTIAPTGLLDLADNDIIIDYTGPSPLNGLLALQSGGQLVSASDFGGISTLLVLFEAADFGLTEFNGVAVDVDAVLGKFTYTGDANLDGQVDAFDYSIVDDNFGSSGSFVTGDLNGDGLIDAFDYSSIDDTFGAGVGSPLRPTANTEVFIPEPSSLGLLALASGFMAGRSRRHP